MNAPTAIENFAPFGEAQEPMLSGPFAPIADESECTDLPLLKGSIPADLNGVYLRAGPNPGLFRMAVTTLSMATAWCTPPSFIMGA